MNSALKNSGSELPAVSVVIIGLNVEQYLSNCIRAVMNSDYPKDKMEVIYVDSGSSDNSVAIARSVKNVKIIELNASKPSAAMGRNAGFRIASHNIIQFVDADSYLNRDWLKNAVPYLKDKTAAVAGVLNERFPQRNVFHRMANLEWNLHDAKNGWTTSDSEAKSFGGNVLILKEALQAANGYDESLPAGEDPDLSYRIRQLGYKILRLNQPMASHDINLTNFSQFFRRTKRSGYAYARLAVKYFRQEERFMLKRLVRIFGGVLAPVSFLTLGFLSGFPISGLIIVLLISFRLVFKAGRFARLFNIELPLALVYSLYLAFTVYPQFLGAVQGLWEAGKIKGQRRRISRQGITAYQN